MDVIDWLMNPKNIPYCGDSLCIFATQDMKTGMHTNGGCRCIKYDVETRTRLYIQRLLKLRLEVKQ